MKVLLLFLENDGVALNMLSCLKGSEIYVVGTKKFCPLSFSRRCSYLYTKSSTQSNIVSQINGLCKDQQIEMIIPTDMESFHLLNKNKQSFFAPVFLMDSEDKINILENKYLFYKWLREHKIQTPTTYLIESLNQSKKLNLKYPTIIKPPNLLGCLGIKKINSENELDSYLKSKLPYTNPPLIIQRYIEGVDIDVSVLCHKGKIIAYTIQQWKELRTLEFIKNNQALNLAKKIIEGLSFTGIAHFDMRVENKTNIVYILECNPRFWGSIGASYMVGVDFIGLGIYLTLGNKVNKIPAYKKDFYILMGSVLPSLLKFKFKFFTKITLKSILEVLMDPLPFVLTQLGL